MNPLTNVKNITKLNETELATGLIHKKSWHDMYKDSAWIFIGGLEYGLTEGDVIAVFSQYGEIENINLIRDKKTGKSKGYCFLCYSNQKSTILAVDNFNGIKLCSRTIRVDHVANYKPPKENERDDEITKALKSEGCAPQVVQKMITKEASEVKKGDTSQEKNKHPKKDKKDKKKKKRKHKSDSSESDKETHAAGEVKVKKEKHDSGYDKYDTSSHENNIARKRHCEKMDFSNGEYSYSKENDRSKINRKYFKTEKTDDVNKNKLKIKTEPESDIEYFSSERNFSDKHRLKERSRTEYINRNESDMHSTSSKSHKRNKSSSSPDNNDQSNDYKKNYRHRDESKQHLKHRKKSKEVVDSNSSSSDDASSTESSSSEDEKHEGKYSRKDNYKTHGNKSKQEDSRDINYQRAGDPYTSSKNKYYNKDVKYAELKSKTKYKDNDRDDSYYKDSHHHRRKGNK